MNFVKHPSNNLTLGAPLGMPNCENLPATSMDVEGGKAIASFWLPDDGERARIAAGKPIVLYVYGQAHPPVSVSVEE